MVQGHKRPGVGTNFERTGRKWPHHQGERLLLHGTKGQWVFGVAAVDGLCVGGAGMGTPRGYSLYSQEGKRRLRLEPQVGE
jgi:hypothetical protein